MNSDYRGETCENEPAHPEGLGRERWCLGQEAPVDGERRREGGGKDEPERLRLASVDPGRQSELRT